MNRLSCGLHNGSKEHERMEDMSDKVMIKLGILSCLLLMFCIGSAQAVLTGLPLNSDPSAYIDPTSGQFVRGVTSLNDPGHPSSVFGDISYAVYNSDNYRGVDMSWTGDSFIYAYQIDSSIFSTADMKRFSVSLPQGVIAHNIMYDISGGVRGGIFPTPSPIAGGLPVWNFERYPITPGQYSTVLLFTSDFAPGMGEAKVAGDGIPSYVGCSVAAPVLVPEPATIALLCTGAAAVLRRRRR
jgi:hypothetical protein